MSRAALNFKENIVTEGLPSAYFEDFLFRLISLFQQEVTADYTTTGKHDYEIVICNNTTPITITLHTLVAQDRVSVVRAGVGRVTVDGNGFNIIGDSTLVLPTQYDAPLLVASSTEWLLT